MDILFNQVVFATPGMLHAGQSLQIFKKWAGNEKNMVRLLMKQQFMLWWDLQYLQHIQSPFWLR